MTIPIKHPEVLVDFFAGGTLVEYKKGEYLIRPGEMPRGVFFIESGLVKSYDITKYGEENLLVIRKAGELLGMTTAVTGGDGKSSSIIYSALVPTTARVMTHQQFEEKLQNNHEATLYMLNLVTEMYRAHSQRILNLEYRTVRERLIAFLLNMADRFGTDHVDGIHIDVPLRHQDIASSISATRETTGREITLLEKKGLLKNSSSRITLCDTEALKKILL